MDILKSLLRNLGRKWSQQPVEIPLLTIEKNQGVHTYATVETGQLHFHSMSYHPTIPQKQSIILDDLTVQELVTTITSMGYKATLTSEAGSIPTADLKAFILMEQRDMPLNATLTAFTSTNWKLLYPLYRLLKQTDGDLGLAINQMYVTSSSGKWLDYWATFFGIRRQASEEDSRFVRRMLMVAFSPKVNNTAMAEIIGFQLKSTVDVNDLQPLKFEVVLSADLINASEETKAIVEDCKAAGIDYLLRYAKTFFEDYPLYIADTTGKAWKDSDSRAHAVGMTEATYGWLSYDGFDLNVDELNGTAEIGGVKYVMDDSKFWMVPEFWFHEDLAAPTEARGLTTVELKEQMPAASEVRSITMDGNGFTEVQYGYDPTGFSLGDELASVDLFGNYLLQDRTEVKVEGYAEVWSVPSNVSAVNDLLVALNEAFATPSEVKSFSIEQAIAGNYRYADEAGITGFLMNVSELNSGAMLTGENTSEAGSMTLLNTTTSATVQTSQW